MKLHLHQLHLKGGKYKSSAEVKNEQAELKVLRKE
jgi:hypothetical protein